MKATCSGGLCPYQIFEGGRCYFHASVADGRIEDAWINKRQGFLKLKLPEYSRQDSRRSWAA